MGAIFKRELRSYFTTPLGYVFVGVFLALSGFAYSMLTLVYSIGGQDADISTYFIILIFSFIILMPILTMKSFAEERRSRTEQLLLTSKVSLPGLVMGKFLAAYSVFAIAMLLSCTYFTTLGMYGSPNNARIFGSVIAAMLVAAAFISVGLFISALTESQLVACIGTIAVLLFFMVANFANGFIDSAVIRAVLNWVSVFSRFSGFTSGFFDFSALLYYASISFAFLFATVRVYESRRWA